MLDSSTEGVVIGMSSGRSQNQSLASLFFFLRDVQMLRTKQVLSLAEYASAGGLVQSLDDLPEGFGVDLTGLSSPDEQAPVLVVPRIPTHAAPAPPPRVGPWLEGGWSAVAPAPELAMSRMVLVDVDGSADQLEHREES